METNATNPTIVTTDAGEVRIQLEGTHTTATETEGQNFREKKNVKFEDEQEIDKGSWKDSKIIAVKGEETASKEVELKAMKMKSIIGKEGKKEEDSEVATPQSGTKFCKKEMSIEGSSWQSQSSSLNEILESPPITCNDSEKALRHQQAQQYLNTENMEISERFKKIMDMFDSFTKNLENLDLTVKPRTSKEISFGSHKRKRPKSELIKGQQDFEEPQKHRSRYDEYYSEDQRKEDCQDSQQNKEQLMLRSISSSASDIELISRHRFGAYQNQQGIQLNGMKGISKSVSAFTENPLHKARSISTATSSCELKSLGCQTLLPDQISLNDISLMEISSLTSRSEPPNSLNNYAQADNACVSHYIAQQDVAKKPLIASIDQQPLMIPAVSQEPTTPAFNIITIETNSTPSSTELRRPPLCHRLWTVIGDFCAATFLCLQVNRDCIFCLGFFAAFVVSASFLTAFFYHTLSISPSLWQTTETIRL